MAKINTSVHRKGHFIFKCPGCNDFHDIGPGWQFNGDLDKPTFAPSILVRCGCYHPEHNKYNDSCWCTHNAERIARNDPPSPYKCYQCHSFIRDGKIEFLNDCSHDLAGQTVDLPEID